MIAFKKLTLARQYMLVSLLVMLAGMIIIGLWISQQIETAVTNRTAAVTALYVDSYISPHLQSLKNNAALDANDIQTLQHLLTDTSLGQQIVSYKIWSPSGVILYSENPDLIGQQFAIEGGLAEALRGNVVTEVSQLEKEEQAYERQYWEKLIETYAPSRDASSDDILAVSEFYQTNEGLASEIRAAQLRSWLLVGVVMTAVYILLAGLVNRASQTIVSQKNQLSANVTQLHSLLDQNQQLHNRVRRAAARTTALNEQYLRRISADLHDGPAQDLALALLRIESLTNGFAAAYPAVMQDVRTVHVAIESAMQELRAISAGLRLPQIQVKSLAETVQRAVYDYEQKTQSNVVLTLGELPHEAPLPVKITLYRVLKESLANSYRHAAGEDQTVNVYTRNDELFVVVSDAGPGFEPGQAVGNGRLGLSGMREGVELLGGQFEISSVRGYGTTIRATLPLQIPEADNV